MSNQEIARLLKVKARLVNMLPLAGPTQAKAIRNRLKIIARKLEASGYSGQQAANAAALAASGVEGIGSLRFQAQAPPGLGRLLRLPFYPTTATANVTTSGTTSTAVTAASSTNPVFIEIPAAGTSGNSAHVLETPQISWATLRLVGFEIATKVFRGTASPGPVLLVKDLKIGGGATLFTHEQFADGDIYNADQPEFCGLRYYPLIKSPNTAQVTVQCLDDVGGESLTCSASLLCEVLVDDNYGAHVPGPYARKGALVRQGGAFVR